MSQEQPCESYASQRKHNYYDPGFVGTNFDFVAMVFETSGAVNVEGLNMIKQLIRFASRRELSVLRVVHGLESLVRSSTAEPGHIEQGIF